MSEAEVNKALVRRYYEEAWVKGNVDAVDEFAAADYVEHGLRPGAEGLKRSITAYRTAFPDWKTTIDDIFAEGEMVTCRWSTSGTHLGDWFGISPTGNHFTATGISVLRIAGGKVVENWTSIDLSPTEEELRWLTEGGEWPRSGEIPSTERDTSPPSWEGILTRTLTWRFRVAEAQERERIEQELRVARQIQRELLPKTIPKLDGWQIATYYGPAREVGGDFYDFLDLKDGRLGLVVGDATGKGMPAALLMSTTRGMLRAVVQALESPGEVLARVNEALVAEIPPSTFVTCFYGVLDPKNGHFCYANAGHNLPCRRHDGQAEELRARGMPLGLMPGMSYEEKEAVLETGESILFYSDGLVEAHDSQGEMFGFPQLRRLVAEHDAEEGSLADFLMEKLYSFVGEGWEQEDDITLVTLQ
jgi:predicted ester cyclase